MFFLSSLQSGEEYSGNQRGVHRQIPTVSSNVSFLGGQGRRKKMSVLSDETLICPFFVCLPSSNATIVT